MRTILFLDVTGVLFCRRCDGDSCGHLANLARIVATLDCDIVLSTSFRFSPRATASLERGFAEHAIRPWIGVTPDLGDARWQEIRAWVEEHDAWHDRLVILDDRTDADLAGHVPEAGNCHFFLADIDTGLDDDLTAAVLRLATTA